MPDVVDEFVGQRGGGEALGAVARPAERHQQRRGVRARGSRAGWRRCSVVAMASTRRPRWRRRAGAAISPRNAELPAPVSTIRMSGASDHVVQELGHRFVVASPATSRQTSGCCPISRIVAPPSFWAGMDTLSFGCSSEGEGIGGGGAAGARIGAHRVADSVDDQRLRDGLEFAGAYPVVLIGQELADQRQRDTRAVEVRQQAPARGVDLGVGPVVAEPVAVAVAPGDALGDRRSPS